MLRIRFMGSPDGEDVGGTRGNYRAVLLRSESRRAKGALSLLGDAVCREFRTHRAIRYLGTRNWTWSDISELQTEGDL